ncbi:uncharacterized protein si:zfos-905g2.1 [Hemibagrus wyckioides]|nr:uncharacterized protein si:zfos-905g2.1 [Hemibagrus wyckioides]
MEPPGFHPPSGMESARVGEMQQNVLLEVLSYCRALHAAVHRLEQKIDNMQAECRNQKISEKPTVSVGGAQLSRSLAQRLGPSPQAKLLRDSEWLQDTANVRGKRDKRRRRRARRTSETQQEVARQVKEKEPRDHAVQKSSRVKWWRKKRKHHAAARSDLEEAPSKERNAND